MLTIFSSINIQNSCEDQILNHSVHTFMLGGHGGTSEMLTLWRQTQKMLRANWLARLTALARSPEFKRESWPQLNI